MSYVGNQRTGLRGDRQISRTAHTWVCTEFRLVGKAMIEADSWSNRELFGFKATLRVPHLDGKRI